MPLASGDDEVGALPGGAANVEPGLACLDPLNYSSAACLIWIPPDAASRARERFISGRNLHEVIAGRLVLMSCSLALRPLGAGRPI